VCGLVGLALDHGVRVQRSSTPTVIAPSCDEAASDTSGSPVARERSLSSLSSGDHVEVKYKGNWLRGVLQDIQGEVAQIQCDVDDCGVITRAPLNRVRPSLTDADFNIEGLEPESEHVTEGFGQC